MASNEAQPVSASSQAFKQQQQELVKLLTQHFHFQFYQMAANSQSLHGEQLAYNQPPALVTPTASYLARLPYVLGAPIGAQMLTNGFDLSPQQNPSASQHAAQQNIENSQRLISSRHQHPATNNKSLIENPLLAMDQTTGCSLSEINLFNALSFSNLTNNQLVLSLQQQQSILQASAAAAAAAAAASSTIPQGLTPADPADTCWLLNHSKDKPIPKTFWPASKRPGLRNSADETHKSLCHQQHHPNPEHIDEGKDMLKFSINTILGNSSTRLPITEQPPTEPKTLHKHYDQQMESSNHAFIMDINDLNPKSNKELAQRHADMGSINCDHSQSDSDECSGSLNQSPTPEAGSSIIFNNEESDHPSANTQHLTGFIADHQQQHNQARLQNQNHLQHSFLGGSTVFPWAVASRGKPRRGMMRRAVFSDGQRVGLEKRFQLQKYISKPDRKKLAEKLGLRDSQVKIWFQNRRMKWRNSKERELLSAGGSREQTLPTRSNPNPDLSDVGETIKRLTGGTGTTIES